MLLLGVHDESTAETLARRLLRHVREPIAFAGREIVVGGSFGVAMFRRGDREVSSDALDRLADAAMYEAKRAGGGVHLHGPECPGIPGETSPEAALGSLVPS